MNEWNSTEVNHLLIKSKLYNNIMVFLILPVFMISIMHLFAESSFKKHTTIKTNY
jgi:hypothetical protein